MRLIDADALYEEHTRLAYEGDYAFHITARAWLEKQPTVDAVPVVRCGNCKRRDKITGWCEDVQDYISNTNWFCTGGEKMDGGADDDQR